MLLCAILLVMNTERIPLLNADKRRERNYAARWMFAGLSVLGSLGIVDLGIHGAKKLYNEIESSAKVPSLTPKQLNEMTKYYVVKPNDTVWGIATAEGPKVADSPEAMYVAQNEITAQLPDKNPDNMQPGEEIRLPADSEIGSTKPIP